MMKFKGLLRRNKEKKKASQRPAVSLPTSANLAPLFPRPQGQENVEDVSQRGLETGVLLRAVVSLVPLEEQWQD